MQTIHPLWASTQVLVEQPEMDTRMVVLSKLKYQSQTSETCL